MNKRLKSSALNILSGNWKSMIAITLLSFTLSYILINILDSIFKQHNILNLFIPIGLSLLNGIIFVPFAYGIYKYSMNLKNGKQGIKTLFIFYLDSKLFFKVVQTYILQTLYICLKFMLFYIPGIIALYEYALVKYLIIKEPKIKTSVALKQSKEMMNKHKMELFSLQFSFLGWYILALVIMFLLEIITICILSFFGIDIGVQDTIIRYVVIITIGVEASVLDVYMRLASIQLFDEIYNKYSGVETIEETVDETIESNVEKNELKRVIQDNRIICQKCDSKNGLKREYCWMCGKKI